MRASPCVRLEVPLAARVKLLTEDYAHFLQDPETSTASLLISPRCAATRWSTAWQTLASQHAWDELVTALLEQHYDPAYNKSLATNYAPSPADLAFNASDLSHTGLQQLARTILAAVEQP